MRLDYDLSAVLQLSEEHCVLPGMLDDMPRCLQVREAAASAMLTSQSSANYGLLQACRHADAVMLPCAGTSCCTTHRQQSQTLLQRRLRG